MSFLGELEDTFDIELDENEVTKITTLGCSTVCKPFGMLANSSKHFILHLHRHWLIGQIATGFTKPERLSVVNENLSALFL